MIPTPTIQMISISKIRVINARGRSKAKFREMASNMEKVGMKTPVTVSHRKTGDDEYDLVCGQGRLEVFTSRGMTEIPALVVDIPLEERLLRSLVENQARRARTPVEMARDILALKERGHSTSSIASEIGLSDAYVSQLLRLLENGEERLIAAVERGDIPITAAIQISSTDDATMQRSLHEGYESGVLRGAALQRVRRIVEERRVRGKELHTSGGRRPKPTTARDLVRTLERETQKRQLLVKKANLCEHQLRFVGSALKELFSDEGFVTLLRAEKLQDLPKHLAEAMKS